MPPTEEEGNEAKYMDENVNLKDVIQCLVDGNLHEKLCRVCLSPLDEFCENIFTRICKEGKEYCIANVLEEVCGLTVPVSDNYCICSNCFICASSAYKFFLITKRSEQIVNFYLNELDKNLTVLEGPIIADIQESICISLPMIDKCKDTFDYDLEAFALERDPVNDGSSCGDSATSHAQEMPEELARDGYVEVPVSYGYDLIIPDKLPIKEEAVAQPAAVCVNQTSPKTESTIMQPTSNKLNEVYEPPLEMKIKQEVTDEEDDVIIVLDENGKTNYFRADATGALVKVTKGEVKSYDVVFRNSVARKDFPKAVVKKERKKRQKMAYRKCSRCEIEYRFISKLVDHMKTDHHVELHFCKICKFTTEDVSSYREHLGEHSNCYICALCGKSFKKRNTMIGHLESHDVTGSSAAGAHVCEICGLKLASEDSLKDHYESKHNNKFTCFYCGRSYKGQVSFEAHVKKHENNMGLNGEIQTCSLCPKSFPSLDKLELHLELEHDNAKPYQCQVCGVKLKSRDMLNSHVNTHSNRDFFCETCGRGFVDARALLWHKRLHTEERPFKCKTCGKGFVSNNRRNSHAVCAHTAPTRRCPLCPALFHLRSMVNSHIKKVHLKAHKRRNRSNKYPDVYWRTETVPIGELSVALQSDILEHIADNTDYCKKDAN